MFGNKFNTKADPVLGAVQTAMQDGAYRRQAEAIVNEAFGVYNRNALVLEQVADYDAAVQDTFEQLKEGVQIDEISSGLARRYIKKAKKDREDNFYEPEKDVNRRNGISLAKGKLTGEKHKVAEPWIEDSPHYEAPKRKTKVLTKESEQIDENANDKIIKRVSKSYKKGMKLHDKKVKHDREFDKVRDKVTNIVKKYRTDESVEQIDEISKGLAGRYAKKARGDVDRYEAHADVASDNRDTKSWKRFERKATNRLTGHGRAIDKLTGSARVPANEEVNEGIADTIRGGIAKATGLDKLGNALAGGPAAAKPDGRIMGNPDTQKPPKDGSSNSPFPANESRSIAESILDRLRQRRLKEEQSFNAALLNAGKSVMGEDDVTNGMSKVGGYVRANLGKWGSIRQVASKALPAATRMGVTAAASGATAAGIAGATASNELGKLATGTETGRAAGKWIGDNVPGAKAVASGMRAAGNFLGVRNDAPKNNMVNDMARRGKPQGPAATKGEAPPKIKPVQTPSKGLGSKPTEAPKATPAPGSFKAAWEAARKEAGTIGDKNKATGQFSWKGKQYQTNDKGEKYVAADKQHVTSIGKAGTAAPKTAEKATPATKPDTSVKTSVSVNPDQSAPEKPQTAVSPENKGPANTADGTSGAKGVAAVPPPPDAAKPAEKPAALPASTPAGPPAAAAPAAKPKPASVQESVQVGTNKYRIV